MSQREEFCRLARQEGAQVRLLCRRYGISPTTGYKWLKRYDPQAADAGLAERSRRPLSSPRQTGSTLEERVVAVRQAHPAWGGRKIRHVLQAAGETSAPAASTITAILRRRGLLDGPGTDRQLRWRRFEHDAPNALWQMDFKGHFPLARGRCHPLTVLDDHSRYALEVGACADERGMTVRHRLEAVFRRYGLPQRLLVDNGSPWGAPSSAEHFSTLGLWLLDLGIMLWHGAPYHPQTQGKDERFHRTLKAEALDGRCFADLEQAQRALDRFRHTYNTVRPHEAIGMAVPASRYVMSSRPMPDTIEPPEYEAQVDVRKVQAGGRISWRGRILRISTAFYGRSVALRPTQTDGCFDLCYRTHTITRIDVRPENKPVHHLSEHLSILSPV